MKTDAELTILAKQCARGEWSEDNAFYYLSELQLDACANVAQESAHLGSLLNEARRRIEQQDEEYDRALAAIDMMKGRVVQAEEERDRYRDELARGDGGYLFDCMRARLVSERREVETQRDELASALNVSLTEWSTLIVALERDGALALEPARMHAFIGIERVKRVLSKVRP